MASADLAGSKWQKRQSAVVLVAITRFIRAFGYGQPDILIAAQIAGSPSYIAHTPALGEFMGAGRQATNGLF